MSTFKPNFTRRKATILALKLNKTNNMDTFWRTTVNYSTKFYIHWPNLPKKAWFCKTVCFTPTSQYFYTDISVTSVTFRNSDTYHFIKLSYNLKDPDNLTWGKRIHHYCCFYNNLPDLPTWATYLSYLPDLPTWPSYLTYLPELPTWPEGRPTCAFITLWGKMCYTPIHCTERPFRY